jgi:hypothetical protein
MQLHTVSQTGIVSGLTNITNATVDLFITSLFNDTFKLSHYTAPNYLFSQKWWIAEDVEGIAA